MRKLLVALAVLLALLAVADRVGVRLADRVLADQLTRELGSRPSVDVRGIPFLTQALRGRYDDVRLHVDGVTRAGVAVRDVSATVAGARVPLGTALTGDLSSVPVQRLAVSGVVGYDQLERLAGRGLTLSPGKDGTVVVSGSVRVAGRPVDASAVATVRLVGGLLQLSAGDVRVAGVTPPRALADALAEQLSLRVQLPTLPYDVTLEQAVAGPAGLALSGTARDAVLTR